MRSTVARACSALAVALAMVLSPRLDADGRLHASGTAGPDHTQPPGKAFYEAACMSCHGPDGRGMPQSIVGFDVEIPDFTDCSFATPEPDADWATIVQHGGPVRAFDRRMPAFRDALSEEQIDSILAYIRGMCAEPAWPRGELNLPRPLRTEKAFPENEAVLTTTVDSTGAGRIGNELVYERRIGARNQLEVKVPIDLQDTDGAGWQRGLGDIAVGFKRAVAHSAARGSILSAGGEIVFPTGKENQGLGSGTTTFEPFLLYGQILPHDTFLHAHAGLELPADRDRASSEAFWRVAGGWTFAQDRGAGRAWSPMIELLGARDLESGAATRWDVVPQVQVTLNRRQHVMANVGVQLPVNDRSGRGTRLVVYLLWDWWDGGLFDGW
jgi:mono/diheme cytochrome c family protein